MEDASTELSLPSPSLLTLERLREGLETLLQTESWDILTLKVVLTRLEQQLLPQQPPGTLKPYKKGIKAEVDTLMKRMLTGDAKSPAPDPPAPAEAAQKDDAQPAMKRQRASSAGEPIEPTVKEDAAEAMQEDAAGEEEALVDEEEQEDEAPRKKRRPKAEEDEEVNGDGDEEAATSEGKKKDDEEEKEAEEAAEDEDEDEDKDEDEDEDEDEDPDAPRVTGKPYLKTDGKMFYRQMFKGETELRVGQDVYLDTNGSEPYVARLQEIFVYSFAPKEVYFNARWYYRAPDCTEYARLAGAPADYEVLFEGEPLQAQPKELFFSMHMDENHADCILRACSVYLLQAEEEPAADAWDRVADSTHEYVAWRAYDNKKVYALTELPSKRLQEAATMEMNRGPKELSKALKEPSRAKKAREVIEPTGPLQMDELVAIWLPRKHLEIWEAQQPNTTFRKVAQGCLIRGSQLINGARSFYAAYVLEVKRSSRPYKLGQRVTDAALRVRTATGDRLVDLSALSNQPITESELSRFKVPLDPDVVRRKVRSLQRAMEDDQHLFDAEDLRMKQEQEERLRVQREEQERAREAEEREAERKERERDEVRRRAAANKGGEPQEAWWLSYQNTGDDKQREIHKLKSRLARFRKIAANSAAEGERKNAEKLALQAEAKLETLLRTEDAQEDAE